MAKGNPLLGQLRGSVGDVVFSRFGGQQVSRSRNRNPKNPQSIAQMIQRAKLGSAVQFFSRGQQNLFKFAFESKLAKESDYNAFMRYNIDRVCPNTKAGVAAGHPVLGNFQMTQGTLPELVVLYGGDDVVPTLVVNAIDGESAGDNTTVGQVSKAIIEKYGLQEGDIITKVVITCANTVATTAVAAALAGSYADGANRVDWNISQFRLDSTSTALASSLNFFYDLNGLLPGDIYLKVGLNSSNFTTLTSAYGIALIVSRPTATGVKVSNSFLHCNKAVNTAIAFKDDQNWLTFVGSTWKATSKTEVAPDAILKGSLSVQ